MTSSPNRPRRIRPVRPCRHRAHSPTARNGDRTARRRARPPRTFGDGGSRRSATIVQERRHGPATTVCGWPGIAALRIGAARRRLADDDNIWVATASMEGVAHLVPMSLARGGVAVLVATPTDAPTVRNAQASGHVRATLDSAVDVVILDTDATVTPFAEARVHDVSTYVGRVGRGHVIEPGTDSLHASCTRSNGEQRSGRGHRRRRGHGNRPR